ncbi:MAG TPA: hypothetical protein EYP21_01870 [Syntrophaceae bacterium]|nr:hypothetical protein [Syntrophaceae bacterium]
MMLGIWNLNKRSYFHMKSSWLSLGSFKTPLIIIVVVLSLIPWYLRAEILDRIVAIVNDDVITLSEVNAAGRPILQQIKTDSSDGQLPKDIQREILEELINKKLADQEVARLNIFVTEEEIDRAIEEIKKDNRLTDDDFMANLAHQGLTMEAFREQVKEQIQRLKLIEQEVKAKITITDRELQDYYRDHIDEFGGYIKVRIQHILLNVPEGATEDQIEEARKTGERILKLIKKGNDFGDLAKRYSKALSAQNGGDPGFFKLSEMPQYLKDIVARLKPGDVSGVVETPIGLQIIKLLEYEAVSNTTFQQVRDELYRKLFQEEVNRRYMVWLKELRDKSYIKILY